MEAGFNTQEKKLFKQLSAPKKIQDFLTQKLKHNPANEGVECRSPRQVLRAGKAHCLEGALLAAAILEFHGHAPLLLDLRATRRDLDHVVAVFKQFGCWGAISKTNHAVLRFREPVYKTLHELVLSYFHEYFLDSGKKTLREYSDPMDLSRFDKRGWMTSEEDLFYIPEYLDRVRHHKILTPSQIRSLRRADPIEIKAGKMTDRSSPRKWGSMA